MKLSVILKNPTETLLYMERMVNDGSPSGFSFINTTTKHTCPFYVDKFEVNQIIDYEDKFVTVGDLEKIENNNIFDFVYVHPDWRLYNSILDIRKTGKFVIPTSSSRTVKDISNDFYIKMAYPGILGRINRDLGLKQIYASYDVNNILYKLILDEDVPPALAFLPEIGGKCYKNNNCEIGYVLRKFEPVGKNTYRIKAQIPAFSLFSKDIKSDDEPIIIQLLREQTNIYEYLFNQLFFPIIDCYFFCIFCGGIQPEMHSQNFLIGIDDMYNICSIILRDLESVDKDITIMEQINSFPHLKSYPYKCICKEQYNYRIKHSFMYDHKLGEYFFDPLISCLSENNIIDKCKTQKIIKNYVTDKYGNKIFNFFPEDKKWYKFDSVLVNRDEDFRPYISNPNPKYR